MGKGIEAARAAGAGIHADVLDDFKDQLMIVLLNRCTKDGKVSIPVAEVDGTGGYLVLFNVIDGVFNFEVRKKS